MDVVETGSTAGDGSFDVAEATDLQIGESLIQVISRMSEERQK